MHVFYLHGFASSPQSGKARFLTERFAEVGVSLRCPDLNEPDFADLTITRMLERLEVEIARLPAGPVVLLGSSLGAFVALAAAARGSAILDASHPLDRLVLLAPALDFSGHRMRHLGDAGLARWQQTDRLEVFHYGYREVRPVRFALYEDSLQFNVVDAEVGVPILIFQGRRDAAVDPAATIRFAQARPNVTLRLLDDDHQLIDSLEEIWKETAAFLGLSRA